MAVRARRTQEERSAATRARLLEATLDCLIDLGYANTTTSAICDRAGVSRGAQLHHYPTRALLLSAGIEHLFQRREREFRAVIAEVPPHERKTAAVDILWRCVSDRTFYAWLELVVASRTDPELKAAMEVVSTRTIESIDRAFRELFPAPAHVGPFYELAPKFTFALMHGMLLEQLVVKDDARWGQILQALKLLSVLTMPGETS